MTLHYNVTREDYEKAVTAYITKRAGAMKVLKPVLLVVAAVMLLLALAIYMSYIELNTPAWLPAVWAVLCLLLAMMSNPKLKGSRFVQTRIKEGAIPQGYFGSQTIELQEERLLISYGMVSDRPYSTISNVEDYPNAVMLFDTNAMLDIIPANAFKSSEERSNFIATLNEKIAATKNKAINNEQVAKSRAEAKLVLEYSYDEAELITALSIGNQILARTSLFMTPARIFILLVGVGIVGFSIYMMVHGIGHFVISLFVMYMGVVLLLPLRLMFMPFVRRAVTRSVQNGGFANDSVGSQLLCVMEDKLHCFNLSSSYAFDYDQLYAAKLTNQYIVLLGKMRTVHVFPAAAFGSEAAIQDFIKFLSEKTDIKIL